MESMATTFGNGFAGWVQEVLSAPRSPWQNAYVQRLIGSIRRECLDHVIVLNEHHLRRILQSYFGYYHRKRTHLSVAKDAPDTPPVQPPALYVAPIISGTKSGWHRIHNTYLRISYV